jgi:hypothetical protein
MPTNTPNNDWIVATVKSLLKAKFSKTGIFIGLKYPKEKRYHWATTKSFELFCESLEAKLAQEISAAELRGRIDELNSLVDIRLDEFGEQVYSLNQKARNDILSHIETLQRTLKEGGNE